jgi:ketosteroid isomerase-like protein
MEETILSIENGAMERWRNGDPMGWAEISADQVTYFDPGLTKPIIGLDEYKAYLKGIEGKVYYQGSEFLNPMLRFFGDAAVLTYNYRSTVTSPDSHTTDQILWNTTEVYFRLAGKWKIVHTHWSFVGQKLPANLEIPLPVQITLQVYEGTLAELMALESAAMSRWDQGDPWGFIDLFAPDITYFDTGTPIRLDGLSALTTEMAGREGKIRYDVKEFISPMVQVQGDLAVLTYRFFSTRLDPDGFISSRVPWNCTEVYNRSGSQWCIVHNHWSYIRGERR